MINTKTSRTLIAELLVVFVITRAVALSLNAANTDGNVTQAGMVGDFDHCVDTYVSGLESVRQGLGAHIHPNHALTRSPRNITFGVSPGRSGSSSLAMAFLDMGFKVAHFTHLPVNLEWVHGLQHCYDDLTRDQCYECLRIFPYTEIPDQVEVVLDWPLELIFIDLFRSFPNARWIMHNRPSHEWAEARWNDENGNYIWAKPFVDSACDLVTADYSISELARMMDLHNELVRCAVEPNNLFEFDVFTNGSEGLMHDLGVFMNMPHPPSKNASYPQVAWWELKELVSRDPNKYY